MGAPQGGGVVNTLPPMGDPIVMAALAHLEAGHDVRAWWCLDLLIRQLHARARMA